MHKDGHTWTVHRCAHTFFLYCDWSNAGSNSQAVAHHIIHFTLIFVSCRYAHSNPFPFIPIHYIKKHNITNEIPHQNIYCCTFLVSCISIYLFSFFLCKFFFSSFVPFVSFVTLQSFEEVPLCVMQIEERQVYYFKWIFFFRTQRRRRHGEWEETKAKKKKNNVEKCTVKT